MFYVKHFKTTIWILEKCSESFPSQTPVALQPLYGVLAVGNVRLVGKNTLYVSCCHIHVLCNDVSCSLNMFLYSNQIMDCIVFWFCSELWIFKKSLKLNQYAFRVVSNNINSTDETQSHKVESQCLNHYKHN